MPERSLMLVALMLVVVGCTAKVEPDHGAARPKSTVSEAKSVEHRVDGTQVATTLRLSSAVVQPGDDVEVTVELEIAPLWEIHPLDAQPAEAATKLELLTPEGIRAVGEWSEPQTTRSMGENGQPVHVGKVVFKRTLAVDTTAVGTHDITCKVSYQVCNERQCLKPAELTLRVPLVVRE